MKFAKYFVLGLLLSSQAHAFISMAESGELVPQGQYQVGVEPQLLTDKDSGGNVDVFFDAPISDSTSARLLLGAGTIDFNAFASVKWIPFPDVDRQPAMGLKMGGGLARNGDQNVLQLQVAPLLSKKFDTEYGLAVPYFAIPFTFFNDDHDNWVASNLAIGSEFHYTEWKGVTLGGEIGLDMNRSYSYISIFAAFPFDSGKGFGR